MFSGTECANTEHTHSELSESLSLCIKTIGVNCGGNSKFVVGNLPTSPELLTSVDTSQDNHVNYSSMYARRRISLELAFTFRIIVLSIHHSDSVLQGEVTWRGEYKASRAQSLQG